MIIAGFIGFAIGGGAMYWTLKGNPFSRGQVMTIRFLDGTWFKGLRKSSYIGNETHGTHHFQVLEDENYNGTLNAEFKPLVDERLAVPINSVKYFVIHGKK